MGEGGEGPGADAGGKLAELCLASLAQGPFPPPSSISQVHKEECCLCFHGPDSEKGLFIDLRSLMPFCGDCCLWNMEKSGNNIYLQINSTHSITSTTPSSNSRDRAVPAEASDKEGQERPLKKQQTTENSSSGERTVLSVLAEQQAKEQQPLQFHYSLTHLPTFLSCPYPTPGLPEQVNAVAASVIAAEAAGKKQQLQQFEAGTEKKVSEAALTLAQLDNGVRIPPSADQWQCSKCEHRQNLWLNLSDGSILCGRRNWDGSGGNGHALAHYKETKFPLCVKLGTITRDLSSADVFSYAEDDAVVDPLLEQHLRHFGIDFSNLTKTEKTTAERELEQNLSFEWQRVEERGQKLQPVFGPGLTGLTNLGNSCYLASVMQLLFSTQPFISTYFSGVSLRDALRASPPDPTADLSTQLVKLAHGLLSGEYSRPWVAPKLEAEAGAGAAAKAGAAAEAAEEERGGEEGGAEGGAMSCSSAPAPAAEQRGIPPRMFKAVIGRNHPEFSTSRQQDAYEYFQYLFELLQQQPLPPASPLVSGSRGRPWRAFEFKVEEKIKCGASGRVSIKQRNDNALSLPIPMEAAVRAPAPPGNPSSDAAKPASSSVSASASEGEAQGQARAAPPLPRVPLSACLEAFARPDYIPDFFSTATNGRTTAQRTVRFLTCPDFLVLHMRKYVVDSSTASWLPKKLEVALDVPMSLDLSWLKAPNGGGLQPGEEELPDAPASDSASAGTASASAAASASATGAAASTGTGTGGARPQAPEADPGIVGALESMGFPRGRCERGAVATHNAGVEEAATWILTHDEEEDMDASADTGAAQAQAQGAVDEGALANLLAFGFSQRAARNALAKHGGDVERAADWILNNPEEAEREAEAEQGQGPGTRPGVPSSEPPAAAAAAGGGGAVAPGNPSTTDAASPPLPDGPARYELLGFVSHLGANTQCGHYVCHIKKDGKWILFNDTKVAVSEDPPFEMGYLYFYQRSPC